MKRRQCIAGVMAHLGVGVLVAVWVGDGDDDPVVHVQQLGVGGVGHQLADDEGDGGGADPLPRVDTALHKYRRLGHPCNQHHINNK